MRRLNCAALALGLISATCQSRCRRGGQRGRALQRSASHARRAAVRAVLHRLSWHATAGQCGGAAGWRQSSRAAGRWPAHASMICSTSSRTQMPYDAPGSLTKQQYADVVAYVLSDERLCGG
mgnify:CR=1 FL=1